MVHTLVIAVLVLGAALAKPPPGPSPWAAYSAGTLASRSLVGFGAPAEAADESGPALRPLTGAMGGPMGGPMSPFFKLKPFLPLKPTFMPPVVDPSQFIGMKADLLNSLFPGGLPPAAPSGLSARALISPYAMSPAPAVAKPPPPAFLADLFKALGVNKTVANATDPVYPAAVYPEAAPVYPGAPAAPFVDPGVFISKKAKFLSDLFAGLAITTPAPAPADPEPAAVNAELAASLQRLLDSLSTASAADPGVPEDEQEAMVKAKRAVDTAALVADAKDKVVTTIIGELAELKDSMVGAVTDLAQAQKAAADAAAAAASAPASKKPLSPYAAMWAKPSPGATPAPTQPPVAVEPVRQKVALLGQVFDMLTEIEKDITSSMIVPAEDGAAQPATPDLMDMVKAKINQVIAQTNGSSASSTLAPANRTALPTSTGSSAKALRLAGSPPTPAGPAVDPTFWIPDSAVVGPDAYLAKTKAFLSNILAAKSTPSPVVRRSFKPSYVQQDQETQAPPSPQQQQPQGETQQRKYNSQSLPDNFLYQLAQQHHHHHNRQPYWWN